MSLQYREIRGVIHCKTGLRIGGSKDDLEIGGNDNPIIRHPITGLPYIPGSSLKGKIRSLLEIRKGRVGNGGGPHNCDSCEICRSFGSFQSKSPTRFIFRDCALTAESEQMLRNAQAEKGINFSELKQEVAIDRSSGKVGRSGPRTTERVPAGAEFDFAMSIRVFERDNMAEQEDLIKEGLQLLMQDYLGGSGSRGYGQVEFKDLTIDGQPLF